MSEFIVADWRRDLANANASNWKEIIYRLLRPSIDRKERRKLSDTAIRGLKPRLVLGSRGFPLCARRRWGIGDLNTLEGRTVLVQGTGNGWDLADWARYGPATAIGVDLYPFDSWQHVKKSVERSTNCKVRFEAAPLDALNFLADGSVDLCASDAVLEHVRDMPGFLAETYRILKPGGILYATYGPMWYSPGGDHYSGRGGLQHAYNHILLDHPRYLDYFNTYKSPTEDFQSGGRYVELDLFSKLRSDQYLAAFRGAGFDLDELILEISDDAIRYRSEYPEDWNAVLARNPTVTPDDLLIKANFVRLKKPSSPARASPDGH